MIAFDIISTDSNNIKDIQNTVNNSADDDDDDDGDDDDDDDDDDEILIFSITIMKSN